LTLTLEVWSGKRVGPVEQNCRYDAPTSQVVVDQIERIARWAF
jgi:hypothetical protein